MVSERGQLLLIGSVLIAITIVASVILLNSIYTPQSLGTDDIDDDAATVEHMEEELRLGLGDLFVETNRTAGAAMPFINATSSGANDGFAAEVNGSFTTAYARSLSDRRPGTVSVEYLPDESLTGWAIYQQDESGFENQSGAGNWTVVEPSLLGGDVRLVRTRMLIEDRNSDQMSFVINDSTDRWSLNVTSGDVEVAGERLCSTPTDADVVVDITMSHGQVTVRPSTGAPRHCGYFDVAPSVGSRKHVRFVGGDNVSGNYTITGEGGSLLPTTTGAGPFPNDFPKRTGGDVVVNPAFEVTYVSSGLTYESVFELYKESQS